MNCEIWQDQLDAFIDGELPPAQMDAMNAHVASCPQCAASALAAVRCKQATREAGRRWTAPAALRRRVLEPAAPRRPRMQIWAPYLATAAALLLAAAFLFRGRLDERHSAQELADLHVATLASSNPVDVISSSRHTVKPWFQGRIPFSFDLPDVDNSPFTLLGGRMAYLRQSPGAQLVYQYQQHRISVFIFRDTPDLELGRLPVRGDVPFHFAAWSGQGLRYIAVGDAGPDVIRQLQERFQANR